MQIQRIGDIAYLDACEERAFTPAVIAGGFVHVSGQASVDLATGAIISGTFEEEMRRCVSNLEEILLAAGSSLRHVVRIGAFVTAEDQLPEYNRIYRELFAHPRPARTTWVSPLESVKVELDAVAVLAAP
ncbi:RidA family protein [Microbacterium sp. ZW T5_56]|uniref:RidA family protein n=1 Tax=Microbacterium sp. ZW T5_56 TaxID=3378081 RepID=UPI0038518442